MLQNRTEISSANELSSRCYKLNPKFEIGTQQDANEFLTSLLTKIAIEEKHGCGTIQDSDHEGKGETRKSLIDQLFRFRTKKTITCTKCGRKSETEEVCNSLLLQPKKESNENIKTIDEAMQYFFRGEVLQGENAYSCEKCNELVKGTKNLSLMEGPNVLVISLGRFSVVFDENMQPIFKKASHFVKFPERLDVTPYMYDLTVEEELQLGLHQYRLTSFISHIGEGVDSGHYVANVFVPSRSSTGRVGSWWKKNDSHVDEVGFEKDASVYMLVYTREDLLSSGLLAPRKKTKSKKKNAGNEKVKGENSSREKGGIKSTMKETGNDNVGSENSSLEKGSLKSKMKEKQNNNVGSANSSREKPRLKNKVEEKRNNNVGNANSSREKLRPKKRVAEKRNNNVGSPKSSRETVRQNNKVEEKRNNNVGSANSIVKKEIPKNKVEGKRNIQRVFLFPKLDMPRKPEWYDSEKYAVKVDDVRVPNEDVFEEIGLPIDSDDEIELIFEDV